jgi:threonine aldolase
MRIDLRSDTFTKPTPMMLEAMMQAEVGDDVFGEDPTVNALEEKTARIFGKEAALYCPSGTMTNQIAIKCHTQPGDEVICDKMSHVYIYEGGGIAFNSACQVKSIEGHLGKVSAAQVRSAINPDDIHRARTRLVSLENTTNRGGGSCYNLDDVAQIKQVCSEHKLALHLDGARIWNAIVAKGENPLQYGELFDSLSVCLSKGLGAPVGSVLIGSKDYIKQARRVRKLFGGAMRQAGYLAAAGIYALDHHVNRLEEDHKHAQQIFELLSSKSFVGEFLPVETNILIFEVLEKYTPKSFAEALRKEGIEVMPISETQVRMVTHLDITSNMMDKLLSSLDQL